MAKSILIVDDSITVRQQLRVFLQNSGYEVHEADNGSSGLEKAKAHPLDLIITDINMPVMNGLEMVTGIRKLPQYSKIPIFVLTTQSSGAIAQLGKAAGATAWIVKPFNQEILLKGIQKVLGV